MSYHKNQTITEGIHIVHNWEYADAATREGATGFTSSDVGKVAKQTDNNTWWVLTAPTPTWSQLTCEIPVYSTKATPTSSDVLLIADAADSNSLKQITIGSLPTASGDMTKAVYDTNLLETDIFEYAKEMAVALG